MAWLFWHCPTMLRRLLPYALAFLLIVPDYAVAAVSAQPCLDLTKAGATAKLTGKLTVQLFAGAPNYESIASGDAEERTLILELPERTCADDGEFIDSSERFDRVHLSSSQQAIFGVLNAAIGRTITVTGEAFGSHTGHHHAPLVMMVAEVYVK